MNERKKIFKLIIFTLLSVIYSGLNYQFEIFLILLIMNAKNDKFLKQFTNLIEVAPIITTKDYESHT
jgi:hypothetical protein